MSEDASVVYTTRQAAEALGVGAAIMRRYAQTLEEITGQGIPQTRRDGRQFSREHLTTLLQAKALVDSHNGLSVEAALRMAASATGDAEGLPVSAPTGRRRRTDCSAPGGGYSAASGRVAGVAGRAAGAGRAHDSDQRADRD